MSHNLTSLDEIQDIIEHQSELLARSPRPVMGWFCAYTPVEILLAAGLHPYRIIPEPGRGIALADTRIERSFCPYVRSCLGHAMEGHYRFLDGLVFVNSCDSMRRLYDVWRYYIGGDFVALLDLPRLNSEPAVSYYRECLEKLIGELEAHYGITISSQAITSAIITQNNARSRLKELYRLNQECGMPVSAVQIQKVIRAGTIMLPDAFTSLVERLIGEVSRSEFDARGGPGLLISGSIMDNPQIIGLIEQFGGRVIADDLCTGTRQFWQPVEPERDPLVALSRHYLNRAPCPRMKDAQRRFDHVFDMINDSGADGVIFYTLKFCDSFLYDIPLLKEQLDERGIPSLMLEGDYTPGTLGRVRTRIEAFIEMLRQNVSAV